MAWWDVCTHGTQCTPWNPGGPPYGVGKSRSDYGIPLNQGTPITAPVSGVVLPQHPGGGFYSVYGQQSFGGEVDILTNMPEYGGLVNVGVIHLDTASVKPGQIVRQGDVIGTSGGQNVGGNWPSNPLYSTAPHVGVQVHAVQSWDALKDPGVLMSNLFAGRDSSQIPTQDQLNTAGLQSVDASLKQASSGQICDWTTWLACASGLNADACRRCAVQGGVNPPNPIASVAGDVGTSIVAAFHGNFPSVFSYLQQPIRLIKLIGGFVLVLLGLTIAFLPDIAAGVAAASGVPEASKALQGMSRGNAARRVRQGILAAGAIQERRTLRGTARRAEARATRQERREQERTRQANIAARHAVIGQPGPIPQINLAPGARKQAQARTRAAMQPNIPVPGPTQQGFQPGEFGAKRQAIDEEIEARRAAGEGQGKKFINPLEPPPPGPRTQRFNQRFGGNMEPEE